MPYSTGNKQDGSPIVVNDKPLHDTSYCRFATVRPTVRSTFDCIRRASAVTEELPMDNNNNESLTMTTLCRR